MKNILITGGCGFIGSNLTEDLIEKKFKVYILDNLSLNKISRINKKAVFIKGDIININNISALKKRFDLIVHLAANAEILISPEKENRYFKDNISGLQEVLNFTIKNKIKKFIFASSASVYGDTKNKRVTENFNLNPKHYYAYTKYIGEEMVKKYSKINGFNSTILRFFNIFGPKSDAVIGKFIAQRIQKKKITVYGNGLQKRDFLHVKDLNNAIIKVFKNNKTNGKTYNLGSGKANSIIQILKFISKKNIIYLPKRNDDIQISISNISKIKKDIGWYPKIKLSEGISKIIKTDYARLKKINLPLIKTQINLIKKFNKNK